MTARRTTISFTEARTALGLTRWQLRLAVRLGFITGRPSGRLELASFTAAAADPTFAARLLDEDRMLASQAAALLGMPVARFRAAAREGLLTAVETGSWRYGPVPYYRRADVIAAAAAIRDWWQAHRRRPRAHDPVTSARRRAAATRLVLARSAAIARLESERAALAAADPLEAPLIAASLWLGRLGDFSHAYMNSAKFANVRSRAAWYAARSIDATSLHDRVFEIIAASGHPLVSVARRPAELYFSPCDFCAAAEPARSDPEPGTWDWSPIYRSQPGCRACHIRRVSLSVVVRFKLAGGTLEFPIPLARTDDDQPLNAAALWTALGDPTLIRHPFVETMRGGGGGYERCLPGMDPPTFKALDPDLSAALFQDLDGVIDELRAAGEAPTGLVPAWYPRLPTDGGNGAHAPGLPISPGWYGPVDQRVVPFELVIAELGAALANFPHGYLFAAALAELPGLDL